MLRPFARRRRDRSARPARSGGSRRSAPTRSSPPGPGVPVTVIDAGLDMTHPEFASRPNTTVLNQQTVVGQDEEHGTAVSSVVGAPVNGVGIVGVYPQAVLRVFDASPSRRDRRGLGDPGDHRGVAGRPRRDQPQPRGPEQELLHGAGDRARVRARHDRRSRRPGNEFQSGNPLSYPADDPHVLTVGATTTGGRQPAAFSSSSSAVDLAAPGVDIPVAVPLVDDPIGYTTLNGTSFSSPLVARRDRLGLDRAAHARETQVFDLMRWSAKDIWDDRLGPGHRLRAARHPGRARREPRRRSTRWSRTTTSTRSRRGGLFSVAQAAREGVASRPALDVTDDPRTSTASRCPRTRR